MLRGQGFGLPADSSLLKTRLCLLVSILAQFFTTLGLILCWAFRGVLERTSLTRQGFNYLHDLFTVSLLHLNLLLLEHVANQWKDLTEEGRNVSLMYLSND